MQNSDIQQAKERLTQEGHGVVTPLFIAGPGSHLQQPKSQTRPLPEYT